MSALCDKRSLLWTAKLQVGTFDSEPWLNTAESGALVLGIGALVDKELPAHF
jgi:hypothetical protein